MKCGVAYVSTKWLVQSSSSSLESFSVRSMSWMLLHSTQPQASVHDITFFRQEHLPPIHSDLWDSCNWWIAKVPLVQAAGPSSEWISHPSHDHVDLAYELPLPVNCAKWKPVNLLVRHGTWEHLWLAANCRFVHSCCRTVCTELCLSVSSSLFPYSEHTNRAHPCCRSSSWPNELPTIIMAAHMFGSDSTVMERLPFAFSHKCTCAVTSG